MILKIPHKFIPGPYHVYHNNWQTSTVYQGEAGGPRICTLSLNEDVVTEENQDEMEQKKEFTAVLLHAAPDMLYAIERILNCINSGSIDHGSVSMLERARIKALGV